MAAALEQNRSDIWEYEGKQFVYRYDDAVVEYGYVDENGQWVEIDGAGLSREHWDDIEAREEYVFEWIMDLDEEMDYLVDDFVKNELGGSSDLRSRKEDKPDMQLSGELHGTLYDMAKSLYEIDDIELVEICSLLQMIDDGTEIPQIYDTEEVIRKFDVDRFAEKLRRILGEIKENHGANFFCKNSTHS